jgi:chemotaxis protein MotB
LPALLPRPADKHQTRWLLPYADLLTVLFITALAVKLTPANQPQHTEGPSGKATPAVAHAMAAVATVATTAVSVNTTLPSVALTPNQRQQWQTRLSHLTRLPVAINPQGQARITVPQGVLFASNQHQLTPRGQQQLKHLLPLLTQTPGFITIEGHTDNQPPAKPLTNRQLSALRAAAVADCLAQQLGLDNRQLAAVAYGDTRPVATNQTPQGQQRNRRVTLVLTVPSVTPPTH